MRLASPSITTAITIITITITNIITITTHRQEYNRLRSIVVGLMNLCTHLDQYMPGPPSVFARRTDMYPILTCTQTTTTTTTTTPSRSRDEPGPHKSLGWARGFRHKKKGKKKNGHFQTRVQKATFSMLADHFSLTLTHSGGVCLRLGGGGVVAPGPASSHQLYIQSVQTQKKKEKKRKEKKERRKEEGERKKKSKRQTAARHSDGIYVPS